MNHTLLFMEIPVLNSLLDNLDEALFILDKEGKILLFNEVAVKLNHSLKFKPFHLGDHLVDSMDLKTSLHMRDMIQEIKLKKEPEKSYEEFVNRNGEKVSLEFNFIPVINEESVVTHIHFLIHDITAKRIYENKIATQAANIASLIETASAIIIGIDTRGYITDWNKHCVEITGYEKEEAYAQKLTNLLLSKTERPALDELIRRGLNREPFSNCEILINSKDGNQCIFLLNCTLRTASTGEVVGLLFMGQDITELVGYRKSLGSKDSDLPLKPEVMKHLMDLNLGW
jgi:PAS domain S-box-containing protein